MVTTVSGAPFWELRFDKDGDSDPAVEAALTTELGDQAVTDLIIFAHGWNNDERIALSLYQRFFAPLADQLTGVKAGTKVGLVGIVWPSELWPDEPAPDFAAPAAPAPAGPTAGVADIEPSPPLDATPAAPTLDDSTVATLHALFPAASAQIDHMADLLGQADDQKVDEFFQAMDEFSKTIEPAGDDGESGDTVTGPPMLVGSTPTELFSVFRTALVDSGVQLPGGGGGTAGLQERISGLWNGAKEALRQTSYWHMKGRAGTVGQVGLGPLIGRLAVAHPALRVHLVGHSFGARLVSYALAGLPATAGPSPIKSVTLFEGAFSHNVFSDKLSYDQTRHGELAGMPSRIDGPLTACFSSFDSSLSTLYPLASMASRQDTADLATSIDQQRWGAIGHDGAQIDGAAKAMIGPVGTAYPFAPGQILNIDSSRIVCQGGPPAGAHSDIVHAELLFIVLSAGRIIAQP